MQDRIVLFGTAVMSVSTIGVVDSASSEASGIVDAHDGPESGAVRRKGSNVLGGVKDGRTRQMRPAVFHLRDLRVGIVRMRPVVVGPFLLALPVEPRQLHPGGGDRCRTPPRSGDNHDSYASTR